MIDGTLELQSFFERGFAVSKIRKEFADELLEVANGESYREMPEDATLPLCASWENWDRGLPRYNDVPVVYRDFADALARQPYFEWYQTVFGAFSHKNIMLQLCKKGNGLGYHFDVFDATHMINILYLSPDDFSDRDGGLLEAARCRVLPDGRDIDRGARIERLGSVVPVHGTLVTVNNLVPTFCHRVTPVRTDKRRISLIMQFGYTENATTCGAEQKYGRW